MNKDLPQKDYGTYERNVQLKIDESFAERYIPADDSVRLLDRVVEEMDLSALMRAYDSHGRPPATPPRTMLGGQGDGSFVFFVVPVEAIISSCWLSPTNPFNNGETIPKFV